MEAYTTAEKIEALIDDSESQKIEEAKTIISNDAFAITDLLNKLINKIEHARISLI